MWNRADYDGRLRLVDDYAEPQDVEEERSALWMQAQTWTVLSALYG